jgi:hypothetical protein
MRYYLRALMPLIALLRLMGHYFFMERYKPVRVITRVVKFNDYYGITYVDEKGFIVAKTANNE